MRTTTYRYDAFGDLTASVREDTPANPFGFVPPSPRYNAHCNSAATGLGG